MSVFQSARETASAMLRDEVVKNAIGVRCQALLRARRAMLMDEVAGLRCRPMVHSSLRRLRGANLVPPPSAW